MLNSASAGGHNPFASSPSDRGSAIASSANLAPGADDVHDGPGQVARVDGYSEPARPASSSVGGLVASPQSSTISGVPPALAPPTTCNVAPRRTSPALVAQPTLTRGLIAVTLTDGSDSWVPRASLARAPTLSLARQLRGEVEVDRDERGRLIIACHPIRWGQVQESLATGAAPEVPSDLLLAQARVFGLDALVERLEAISPGFVSGDALDNGFVVKFAFTDAAAATDSAPQVYTVYRQDGLAWSLHLDPINICLILEPLREAADVVPAFDRRIRLKMHPHAPLEVAERKLSYPGSGTGTMWHFVDFGASLHELSSRGRALHRGGVVLSLEVRDIVAWRPQHVSASLPQAGHAAPARDTFEGI